MRDEGALASLSSRDDADGIVTLDIVVPGVAAAASLHSGRTARPAPPTSLVPGVLVALGIAPADIAAARMAARMNGADLGRELVCAGRTTEESLAAAMAAAIDLPAEQILPMDQIVGDAAPLSPSGLLRTCNAAGHPKLFLAPRIEALDALSRSLAVLPASRAQARIATPSAIAGHRAAATVAERSRNACLGLAGSRPSLSARQVLTGTQGAVLATLLAIIAWTAAISLPALLLVLHLAALPVFLCGMVLRAAAACDLLWPPAPPPSAAALRPLPHPAYSVLVALRDEAEVVPALVAALAALRWPRSKLQVLIVCEADDPATLAAVDAAIADEPGFAVVLVPPAPLRTKPKALNVALPLVTGEFVVLFDAEDRPHPDQLEEAWRRFRLGGERLACLQAPLVIGNGEKNWLAAHFALEYAALFRGFLPWLARHGLPLPLGGTSNHFRRDALVAVGAWDSHNVTEDADLGIRFCRHGYRVGTIETPTEEDAPERWPVWLKQRSRWMKGWMQTWLVHMRHPRRLWRDLGPRGFAAFQILFVGMIGSSLAHPLCIVFLGWTLFSWLQFGVPDELACWLFGADLVSLVFGFGSFALLAGSALEPKYRPLAWHLASVHVYWLLISVAAARGLAQLCLDPHRWEKTPHGQSAAARR